MRFLQPVIFIAIVLAAVELTFSVYLYGPAALDPRRMDSFVQIHHSGMVQPAADPDVYFELKPGLDRWYKGVRFTTNSAGLRDEEITLAKPAATFRVAVVGSSWTMGSGVELADVWHQQLEAMLNSEGQQRYEFINFGVDQYGYREIIATLESKALAYQPDLIIFAVTHYTPAVLWPDEASEYQPAPQRHAFFELHALRVIDTRLGLNLFPPDPTLRERVKDKEQSQLQVRRTIAALRNIESTTGVPVVIAKLAYQNRWSQQDSEVASLADYPEFEFINIADAFTANGYAPKQMRVSVWDGHPNPFAHQVIATALRDKLTALGVLAGS